MVDRKVKKNGKTYTVKLDSDIARKIRNKPISIMLSKGYLPYAKVGGKLLHRLILKKRSGGSRKLVVSHKNDNGLDNRRKNLESSTQQLNLKRAYDIKLNRTR